MGLCDFLFGGCKKGKDQNAKPKKAAPEAAQPVVVEGLTPEVVAAISTSVSLMLEDASAELVASVTAAIVHTRSGTMAVRTKQSGNTWAASGWLNIMNGCQKM